MLSGGRQAAEWGPDSLIKAQSGGPREGYSSLGGSTCPGLGCDKTYRGCGWETRVYRIQTAGKGQILRGLKPWFCVFIFSSKLSTGNDSLPETDVQAGTQISLVGKPPPSHFKDGKAEAQIWEGIFQGFGTPRRQSQGLWQPGQPGSPPRIASGWVMRLALAPCSQQGLSACTRENSPVRLTRPRGPQQDSPESPHGMSSSCLNGQRALTLAPSEPLTKASAHRQGQPGTVEHSTGQAKLMAPRSPWCTPPATPCILRLGAGLARLCR